VELRAQSAAHPRRNNLDLLSARTADAELSNNTGIRTLVGRNYRDDFYYL